MHRLFVFFASRAVENAPKHCSWTGKAFHVANKHDEPIMTIRAIWDERSISDRLLNNGAVSMPAFVVLTSIVNDRG